MRGLRRDLLTLSLLAEPGDPSPHAAVTTHGVRAVAAAARHRDPSLDAALERSLARAEAAGLRWVCRGDAAWPDQLADLDHAASPTGVTGAPWGLWLKGTGSLAELADRSVAVVGARECTTYGAESAAELAADLTDRQWTVISGAAFGIDACAHRGALAMDRPTVAVLACGADIDYPRAHATLLGRIAENGLVVSEYAPGEAPHQHRFLARNRIIAALSRGTVVVEAAARSGSLNTLHWADRLGRVTMAVPGPVTSRQSAGVHAAIREGESVLVTGVDDVETELAGVGWVSAAVTV